MVSQVLQVLVLILTEGLCNLRLLDNVEHELSFLLELFVGRDGLFTLLGELCDVLD